MMTPEELTAFTDRVRAFLDANAIECLIGLTYSYGDKVLILRLEDFERVFRGREVNVMTQSGFDHIRAECDGFGALALRPMPMVLGPRVEVMP